MVNAAGRSFARAKGVIARGKAVAGYLARAPKEVPVIGGRCEVAIRHTDRLALSPRVARALDETYERFDGRGAPRKMRGEALNEGEKQLLERRLRDCFARMKLS